MHDACSFRTRATSSSIVGTGRIPSRKVLDRLGSSMKRDKVRARSSTSPGQNNRPFRPSATTSGRPPMARRHDRNPGAQRLLNDERAVPRPDGGRPRARRSRRALRRCDREELTVERHAVHLPQRFEDVAITVVAVVTRKGAEKFDGRRAGRQSSRRLDEQVRRLIDDRPGCSTKPSRRQSARAPRARCDAGVRSVRRDRDPAYINAKL